MNPDGGLVFFFIGVLLCLVLFLVIGGKFATKTGERYEYEKRMGIHKVQGNK